jgi:hypothetical protein
VNWLNSLLAAARQWNDGQAGEQREQAGTGAAHPEDQRGLHDAPGQRQGRQIFISGMFAREIAGFASLRAESRDLNYFLNAGCCAGREERLRRTRMDVLECLLAALAKDADSIDDHIDSSEPRHPY